MSTATDKPAGKYESFISSRLEQTLSRIRLLDLLSGTFTLAAGTLAFIAALIVLDVLFKLPDGTRQVFALFYLVAVGLGLWYLILRPLGRDLNPHYAARKLEENAGPGRHYVVNWIDLQGKPLPGPFRAGLDRRAAKDVQSADPEKAISNRWAIASGVAAGLMAAAVISLFITLGPGPFAARFRRAFGGAVEVPARTQIEVLTPQGGDGVVTVGSPARVVVKVDGPHDGATLHIRHDPTEPWRPRPMTQDAAKEWSATVGPLEVGTGFWYRVTAGDGQTPEHRIGVRATPSLGEFLATYRYRPYVNRADRTRTVRALDDLRGTEVTITTKPNREVRESRLDFRGADGRPEFVNGEVTPQGLRFRLVLDRAGQYRLSYEAVTGERYDDASPHPVTVQPDNPPAVKITSPAKHTEMPANGELVLTAEASDDIGVAGVTLKRKVDGGADLPDVPYMADKLGTAAFGTPRTLSYRDALRADGQKPGTVIEYWLEARDACDYKEPNVGRSEKYKVKLTGPGDPEEEKKKKDEEKKKKDEHDKKQEEGAKKEKEKSDDDKKKEEGQEQADAMQRDQGGMGMSQADEQPKDGGDKDTQDKADQVREALNNKDPKGGAEKKGDGKGKGEQKGPKPGEDKPSDGGQAGDSKGGMTPDKGDAEAKPEPKEPQPGEKGGDPKPGEGRGPGGGESKGGAGERKPGEPMPGADAPGEGKSGEPNDAASPDEKAGAGKPGAGAKPADNGKGPAEKGPPPEGAKGKPGDGPPPTDGTPGEAKEGKPGEGAGKGDGKPADGKGESKGGEGPPAGEGGEGKGGSPDPGMGEGGKPGGMGGMAGGASDKAGEDGTASAAGGTGGKPGQVKEAGGGGGEGKDDPTPARRERPVGARATQLQLEEFRRAVGDDVLKDAKMSREQFERFLRDYAALAARMKKEEEERDNIVPGAPGASVSSGRVGPAPTPGSADPLRGGGRPKPPSEYRDSFADFLKRLR